MKKNNLYDILSIVMLVILSISFTSCGNDDEDEIGGSLEGSLEGTWRIKSIEWSHYVKGGSIDKTSPTTYTYENSETRGLNITYSDGKYTIVSTAPGTGGTFEQVGINEFKRDDQRLVIVGVHGSTLTAEFYEDYYKNSDGKRDEYGLLTFEKGYDNSNDDSNTEEEQIQTFAGQTFVGRWTGYGTWEFNADGTCSYSLNWKHTGTWKYIPESQTLVTDILNWNWKVITVSENQWVGTHLAGNGSTITYSRAK